MAYKTMAVDNPSKLLECIIIQCNGKIDSVIAKLLEPALERLTKEIKGAELRQMCLQVFVLTINLKPTKYI